MSEAFLFLAGAVCVAYTQGHGMMLDPISRNAPVGINTIGGNMWVRSTCEAMIAGNSRVGKQ